MGDRVTRQGNKQGGHVFPSELDVLNQEKESITYMWTVAAELKLVCVRCLSLILPVFTPGALSQFTSIYNKNTAVSENSKYNCRQPL